MRFSSGVALALVGTGLAAGVAHAQETQKLELPRPSPNATLKQTVGLTDVTIAYSSPAVRGRTILGNVVPYDAVWRAGANECTKVTFSTSATIGGKSLGAGTNCLFLLPTKSGWTFILNKDTTLSGNDGYKPENDVLRVPAAVTVIPSRERLAYAILDFTDDGGNLAMEWDTVRVAVRFELNTRATVLAEIRALKTDDWRQYNRAARYLLDAKLEPAYALELVNKSIKLKEEWENDWTKAQLLGASGNTKEALALAQRSQELGKASKNFFYADDVAKAISTWKK
jgi:Protein of unknown function (DUF2911)